MPDTTTKIRIVEPSSAALGAFRKYFSDCIVLSHDGKIMLQERGAPSETGYSLNAFGGHMEADESPIEGMIRELKEELGAIIPESEAVFLGAVTEEETVHKDIVHVYFWHDCKNTITGCYEWQARYFEGAGEALRQQGIMDYTVWAINECLKKGLIK